MRGNVCTTGYPRENQSAMTFLRYVACSSHSRSWHSIVLSFWFVIVRVCMIYRVREMMSRGNKDNAVTEFIQYCMYLVSWLSDSAFFESIR